MNNKPALGLDADDVKKYLTAVQAHLFTEGSNMPSMNFSVDDYANFVGDMHLRNSNDSKLNIHYSADPLEPPEMQDDRIAVMVYNDRDRACDGARLYREYLNIDDAIVDIENIDWSV